MKLTDITNEAMVQPKRGHNYYQLTKDVPVRYVAYQTNPTGATGVMLHNTPGYLKGKKGAYIIDYYGGHYYVDMKAKFATSIYDLDDQPWKRKPVYKEVDLAPDFASWKNYKEEISFKRESVNEATVTLGDLKLNMLQTKKFKKHMAKHRIKVTNVKVTGTGRKEITYSAPTERDLVHLFKAAGGYYPDGGVQWIEEVDYHSKNSRMHKPDWYKLHGDDKLDEASINGTFDGEPDTGYLPKGRTRKLGTNAGKPEAWFEGGGYEQVDFPVADDIYGPGSEPDLKVTKTTTPSDESLVKEAIKKTGRQGNPIPATATSLKDFVKHIKSLPEGPWDELRYPVEAQVFNPKRYTLKNKPLTSSEKAKFIKAITNITKVNEKKGTPIYSWEIGGGGFKKLDSPDAYAGDGMYYVNLRSKSSDDFGKKMSSGQYGSLD